MLVSIPFSQIYRTATYINTSKLTPTQVRENTGAKYVLNAGMFDMSTFKPCANTLRSQNQMYCHSATYPGYGLGKSKPEFSTNVSLYEDFIGGFPDLIINNKPITSTTAPCDPNSKRGRAAIGLTNSSLVLWCTSDSVVPVKISELASQMQSLGCMNAINFDGGGSCQCDFAGSKITSSRRVYSYFLVFDTKPSRTTIKKGSKGQDVYELQRMLGINADGEFGVITENAVKAYQREFKLTQDGIVGVNTWSKLYGDVVNNTTIPTTSVLELLELHPSIREKAKKLFVACQNTYPIKITSTWRSWSEQNLLYERGRTLPGGIVTNCKYPESPHNWGVAFDFCRADGKADSSGSKGYFDGDGFFSKVGQMAKTFGLFWGGDFKSFTDKPHLEDPDFLPNNSVSTLKSKYGTPEAFKLTWGETQKTIRSIIKNGSRGTDVVYAQNLLIKNGYAVTADGIFGNKTELVIKSFQTKNKLVSDGIVGSKTWAVLEA